MSRAKKGAASEGQVPAQKEAAESPSSVEQLFKTMMEKMKSMDKTVQGLKEKLSNRIEALESNQRSLVGNTGPQEEKSGERDATEVGGQEITPSEHQSRLPASSSYEPSRFLKMEQPRQQPPPPMSQPPPLTYHHSQPFSAPEPFLAGRQYQPVPSAVGEQVHRPLPIAGTRGMSSAGDPITMPWKLNPPMFNGDSLQFRSFRKEATTFADCCGFGEIFEGNHEVPTTDGALTNTQIKSLGFTDAEIERHRKAYQFLRSAGILLRANSPTEAWRNLESWHNPKSISATQALHDRFQSYFYEAWAKSPCCPYSSGGDGISALTAKNFYGL